MAFLRPWIAEVQVNHLNLPRCEYIKNFTDIPKDQTYIVDRRFFFRYFLCGIVNDAFLHFHTDVIDIPVNVCHSGDELSLSCTEFHMNRLFRMRELRAPFAFQIFRFFQKKNGSVLLNGFFNPGLSAKSHKSSLYYTGK